MGWGQGRRGGVSRFGGQVVLLVGAAVWGFRIKGCGYLDVMDRGDEAALCFLFIMREKRVSCFYFMDY